MDLGIRGRTALVLGAGGGLGGAIAIALAREGVHIALGDVNDAALSKVGAAVQAAGAKACAIVWDLADLTLIERNVASIEERLVSYDFTLDRNGEESVTWRQPGPERW